MRKIIKHLPEALVALGLVVCAGCEHYRVPERGQPLIAEDLTKKIIRGVTTKKDVKELLGKPHESNLEGNTMVWKYWHSPKGLAPHMSIGGSTADSREWKVLIIKFELSGKVEDYSVQRGNYALDGTDKAGGILPKLETTINVK